MPQGYIFTVLDTDGGTHVSVGDLGAEKACTGYDWDGEVPAYLCGDCREVPTDKYAHLYVGGRAYRVTMLRSRVRAGDGPLDVNEWKTLAPVLGRCVDPSPQMDPLANAYAHACGKFLDKVVGWNSKAGLGAMVGLILYINPPWIQALIALIVDYCLDVHDAGAWLCLPYWPGSGWLSRLSIEAVLKHAWPAGTRGLFAPAIHNYDDPVGKGSRWVVQLWWVRPRL